MGLRQCETLIQAPVPAQMIEKGIPTAGLLAHVMTGTSSLMTCRCTDRRTSSVVPADHRPLDAGAVGRASQRTPSASGQMHCAKKCWPSVCSMPTYETPAQMLAPGQKKNHRAYVWVYSIIPVAGLGAVVYDFSPQLCRRTCAQPFPWKGKRVCDYLAGYKANSEQGITGIGCMAHARRKSSTGILPTTAVGRAGAALDYRPSASR